jgi:transposase
VSTSRQADTKQAGAKRRRWSAEFKRELVAATLEPGASVALVARRHDLNANQLFRWRRELTAGPPGATGLVPVEVTPPPSGPLIEAGVPTTKREPGRIEITLAGGVRVKIEGAADPAAVAAALGAVMKSRRRRR